jgi:hypothetical protein
MTNNVKSTNRIGPQYSAGTYQIVCHLIQVAYFANSKSDLEYSFPICRTPVLNRKLTLPASSTFIELRFGKVGIGVAVFFGRAYIRKVVSSSNMRELRLAAYGTKSRVVSGPGLSVYLCVLCVKIICTDILNAEYTEIRRESTADIKSGVSELFVQSSRNL